MADSGEQLRQSRASALVRERDTAAEDVAFKAGRESMKIDAHLATHDRELKAINGSIVTNVQETKTLVDRIGALETAFEKYVDIAKTRSEIAVEAAQAALSKRTFIIGCLGVVGSFAGLTAWLH
jgi:hypothetical protein